jgi:hypothetical protein
MANKSYNSGLFKRIIDLGVVREAEVDDLVRIWRVGTGDEKAITLANFVGTVDRDLGDGDSLLTEIVEALEERITALEGDLESYVPYTGATGNVDLGENGITTEWVKLNTTPVIPTDQGSLYWDEDDNVLAVVLNGAIQKVGEVTFYNVKNQTGSTIPKGTGVGFAGVVGSSGRIKVAPFLANGSQPSIYYVGITAEEILDGEDGKVYNFGPIRGLNTSAFSEGDVLYASSTVAGGFTTTPPTAPNNVIVVAAVLTDSATVGALLVRVTVGDLGGGSAGAGAGLSIDGGGDIQLGKTYPFDSQLQYVDLQEFDTEPIFILATDFDSYYISRDSPYSAIEVFSGTNEAYNFTSISSDNDAASVVMYASNSPRTAYAKIKVDTFTSESSIELSRDHLLVTDSINSKGLENLDDYESNFTARSLVTKQYVDGVAGGYPEAVERENNTVLFDKDYVIGNATARTGNILFDFTGAKLMGTTMMLHNSGTAPTFPAQAVKLGGEYELSENNYIYFQLTRKTASSEIVLYTISQVV